MGIKLTDAAKREPVAVGLREMERADVAGRTLAVCERADGALILAREVERGTQGADGKRSRDNGTEKILKPTSALADIAHALSCGLLA